MKRMLCLMILALAVGTLMLAGCKKKEETPAPQDVSKKAGEAVSGAADAAKGMAESMKKAVEKK